MSNQMVSMWRGALGLWTLMSKCATEFWQSFVLKSVIGPGEWRENVMISPFSERSTAVQCNAEFISAETRGMTRQRL